MGETKLKISLNYLSNSYAPSLLPPVLLSKVTLGSLQWHKNINIKKVLKLTIKYRLKNKVTDGKGVGFCLSLNQPPLA